MREYNIIELKNNKEYDNLIIICNANSPFDYILNIDEEINGKVIVDQILHVGNTEKRFISANFVNGSLVKKETIEFVNLPKSSSIRKISCEYLKISGLIDHSILSSVQKKMINKGISI